MPQQHLDRLSSIDASFLHQEGPTSHMHIGGVLIFEGPPPAFEDFLDHVRGRLHLVPRYRQKLATPPLETGRPLWVDDPNFNLEYHIRNTALPAPGTEQQLLRWRRGSPPSSSIAPSRCGRCWLVEGLEGDRFGLISKTHHSLVDGVAGVDLATVLFDARGDAGAAVRRPRARGSRSRALGRGAGARRGSRAWSTTSAGIAARALLRPPPGRHAR